MIKVYEERSPQLIDKLLKVWRSSVEATHDFLSIEEINQIAIYIPDALKEITTLLVVEQEEPVAFMGIEENWIEMLFVAPQMMGNGLGTQLIHYAMEHYFVNRVTVNEQNPQALGFYEHMGFHVESRSQVDGQRNPYPILYMSHL